MIIILLIVIIGAILFPNFFKFTIELAVLCVLLMILEMYRHQEVAQPAIQPQSYHSEQIPTPQDQHVGIAWQHPFDDAAKRR